MPPLIHAALSWIVGAFVGTALSAETLPTWLAAVMAGAASALTSAASTSTHMSTRMSARASAPRRSTVVAVRYRVAIAAALLSAGGVIHARASAEYAAHCTRRLASRLTAGDTLRAVFDERVVANSGRAVTVRGEVASQADGCRVAILARIAHGAAAPGEWVALHGAASATERGLRVEAELVPVALVATVGVNNGPRRDWRRAARGRTGEIIDRDFGRNAPLVRALLIADQDGIPPSLRDTFADAGLVHMLSISGLHVAIIAVALLTLAGALRVSRSTAFAIATVVITLYVAALGAPPPAVRSAVMLVVVGLSEHLQRPTHPWTALALGAVIPTVQPDVVVDLGWQLSVSGMASLVAARALMRRLRVAERRRWPHWSRRALSWLQRAEGWRYAFVRELVTGTVATLVTAPLIAWTFGRVSVIAPLSNIVAAPIVGFVQPALFLALLLSPWPAISGLIADATAPPLALLDAVARGAANVPFASLHVAPTALGAVCAGVASAAFVRATASRRWVPGLLVAAAALTVGIWAPTFSRGSGMLELHVIDVGQGDALAVRTPKGRWLVMDAGRRWDGGDAGRRTVVPYLRRIGGDVAIFVLSHAHDDHVGGAASVLTALTPARWWEPAFVTGNEAYRRALEAVRATHATWHRVHPGDQWSLDGIDVLVLAPDSTWTAAQENANETSVVLRVSYGRVSFLLTGDAEADEERWILDHTDPALLHADVLKLGHHGSKTSSSLPFLSAVRPRLGVVSVGAGNRYGHPSIETLAHFAEQAVPLLRTDLEGSIVVSTNGDRITVRTRADRWTLPP